MQHEMPPLVSRGQRGAPASEPESVVDCPVENVNNISNGLERKVQYPDPFFLLLLA
jgi:hypothetical protein